MTLYELTKKYGEGKGEGMMWKAVHVISDAVDSGMDEYERKSLMKKVYGLMSDGHYNEETAHDDVSVMYYTDTDGKLHQAPYWPEEAVRNIYGAVREEIPDYNFWDFYVTMNMVASDNWCLFKRWFRGIGDVELNEKITDAAIVWLKDEDWPTKTKIWDYLSSR